MKASPKPPTLPGGGVQLTIYQSWLQRDLLEGGGTFCSGFWSMIWNLLPLAWFLLSFSRSR